MSLVWDGDELVDWVAGGLRYSLDGTVYDPCRTYGYRFDHCVVSPNREFAVILERLGTKGLILNKKGDLVREINRSYEDADVYEYPITFLTLPDTSIGIAHCPDEYYRLEIEEVSSGKRLTGRPAVNIDYYHSRLAVSPNSHNLLSAGWVWHPLDFLQIYNLGEVYAKPSTLDELFEHELLQKVVEINNAAFIDDENVIFTTAHGSEKAEESVGTDSKDLSKTLSSNSIAVYDLTNRAFRSTAFLKEQAGTLMPLGSLVVGFYQYPKLIEVSTGEIIIKWPEINSGEQNSSIIGHLDTIPPLALDARNKRFAVASKEVITVIQLG